MIDSLQSTAGHSYRLFQFSHYHSEPPCIHHPFHPLTALQILCSSEEFCLINWSTFCRIPWTNRSTQCLCAPQSCVPLRNRSQASQRLDPLLAPPTPTAWPKPSMSGLGRPRSSWYDPTPPPSPWGLYPRNLHIISLRMN